MVVTMRARLAFLSGDRRRDIEKKRRRSTFKSPSNRGRVNASDRGEAVISRDEEALRVAQYILYLSCSDTLSVKTACRECYMRAHLTRCHVMLEKRALLILGLRRSVEPACRRMQQCTALIFTFYVNEKPLLCQRRLWVIVKKDE